MNKEEAVRKLLSEKKSKNIIFNHTLSSSASARMCMKMLNEAMRCDPDVVPTGIALHTYMPMKWASKHRLAADMQQKSEDLIDLEDVSYILQRMLGNEPDADLIDMSFHDRQFEYIDQILQHVDDGMKLLGNLSKYFHGPEMYHCLMAVHIDPNIGYENDVSRHIAKNYYIKAVREIQETYGIQIDMCLNRALYLPKSLSVEQDELYHNTEILMKAYLKILARFNMDNSIYQRVLKCKTVEELSVYDKLYRNYEKAETILQYMLYIRRSIEVVQFYPIKGELYYNLIMADIENKLYSSRFDLMLKRLHMSRNTFYQVRREAYDVLSLVLWGYSTRSMIGMLGDNRENK